MKGSVTKYAISGSSRPRWRYRVDAGADENGRRIQEGRGGFAKQGEAETAMAVHIEELRTRITETANSAIAAALPKAKTLGEWLTEWLDMYAPDRCQLKTLERYRGLAAYVTSDGPFESIAQSALGELKHGPIEAALLRALAGEG